MRGLVIAGGVVSPCGAGDALRGSVGQELLNCKLGLSPCARALQAGWDGDGWGGLLMLVLGVACQWKWKRGSSNGVIEWIMEYWAWRRSRCPVSASVRFGRHEGWKVGVEDTRHEESRWKDGKMWRRDNARGRHPSTPYS